MIPVTVRIFASLEPVDMRRGFDGLALIARERMQQDPRSGSLFIFTNARRNRLKALWWDRNGYCILYKRFHNSVCEVPLGDAPGAPALRIDGQKLAQLLAGAEKKRPRAPNLRIVR